MVFTYETFMYYDKANMNSGAVDQLEPLLLTWFNFNPSMDT